MILDLFRKHNEFYNIQGYDDMKDIVRRALDAGDNYNLLFVVPHRSTRKLEFYINNTIGQLKGVAFFASSLDI